jgi:hypothetical protein
MGEVVLERREVDLVFMAGSALNGTVGLAGIFQCLHEEPCPLRYDLVRAMSLFQVVT